MFEVTQKGRAYIDAALQPYGECAPWLSLDARRAWRDRPQPSRVTAAPALSPAA
jgi:hypothetical protein